MSSTTNLTGAPGTCPTRIILSARQSRTAFPLWCRNSYIIILVVTIALSLQKSGLDCLGPYRPDITGGAYIVNPRSSPPRRIGLISLMRLILTVSWYLVVLAINSSQNPVRLNNRTLIYIASPRAIVSSTRRHITPISGISFAQLSSAMHLILSKPRRTWMDIWINTMLLSISFHKT